MLFSSYILESDFLLVLFHEQVETFKTIAESIAVTH